MEQHRLCFETLANTLRLQIIELLRRGALNVSEIAKATGAERSNVSHALQILRGCNFVTATKQGREVRYELNPKSPIMEERQGNLFTIIEAHACGNCEKCFKHGNKPQFEESE